MAPQGSGNVLLVVVNPTTLVPADAEKKALFESWGYTVNVISESANQSAFDAEATMNDVVYVSSTVNSNQLGTKLASLPIGVVSEDGDYNPDLGFAAGAAWTVGSAVNVTDTSHYITAPFAAGSLGIYSGGMEQLTVSGSEGPGLQTLADTGGAGSLVVLDSGAMGSGGSAVAGPRVMLPLGRWANFNWDYLNNSGRLLVQRALQWGMGNIGGSPKNLLLVVVDPASLTAQEAAKKALIEGWGYTVNLIDESDSQASFDAAVADNDVAYISEDINATNLGTRLANATIGVVNEEGELVDELGIANSVLFKSRSEIDVIDNSHYITEPFATGLLTFVSSPQSVHILDGGIAPGLQVLAETFNVGSQWSKSMGTLESGDTLSDGGSAAGRRVHLPWGGGTFNINQLTDDGRTIMQRAIEWAEGADAGAAPQKLLLVAGNAGSLTTEELAHKSLVESWGYMVAVIDDSDDQATFDAAVAGNDVVLITNDVTASTVGTKLVNATIGVVTSEVNLSDEFGMSASVGWDSGTQIEINDNSHYITQPFATGLMTILSSAESLAYVTGTLSPDLGQLASSTSGYGIVTLEAGAATHTGGIAAGRRAQLPWGGNGFNPDNLNADGKTILQRSLEWAAAAGSGGGGGPGYTEMYQAWSATSSGTWQTVDLGAYGVPANAVVEVALQNNHKSGEIEAGVRAVGSSLERRFLLHEAEGGGVDTVTMHVQTDASSQIQHYSGSAGFADFNLLGYWTGATYVERFDAFKAGADASWQARDLGAYGVGANQVAELALSQTSTSIEWLVGARRTGSSLERRISLHEAEGGGIDAVSLMVKSDASSIIEVYAGANSVVDFHLLGYWSTPPGTYTESGGVHGQASDGSTWETADLTGFGVPANAVAQFVSSNQIDNFNRALGVREVGSDKNRVIELQEAEAGGGDLATMHVNVDSASSIEWYSDSGTAERFFYPVGWWVLP